MLLDLRTLLQLLRALLAGLLLARLLLRTLLLARLLLAALLLLTLLLPSNLLQLLRKLLMLLDHPLGKVLNFGALCLLLSQSCKLDFSLVHCQHPFGKMLIQFLLLPLLLPPLLLGLLPRLCRTLQLALLLLQPLLLLFLLLLTHGVPRY